MDSFGLGGSGLGYFASIRESPAIAIEDSGAAGLLDMETELRDERPYP